MFPRFMATVIAAHPAPSLPFAIAPTVWARLSTLPKTSGSPQADLGVSPISRDPPDALLSRLASSRKLLVIDVRESPELEIAPLPPTVPVIHWPTSLVSRAFARVALPIRTPADARPVVPANLVGPLLDAPDEYLVGVLCNHGVRSANVVQLCRSWGASNVCNIDGGIDRYARDVDPSIPEY